MAKAIFKMPDDFLMKISQLGEKTAEIIPRVLKAGGGSRGKSKKQSPECYWKWYEGRKQIHW